MTDPAVTTNVVRNEELRRYELWYGDTLAGFAEYRERGKDTVFTHTEVGDQFGGKGLGSTLAHDAIEDVIARGHVIVPRCPFIKAWLDKHPEYGAHVMGSTPR